MINIDSNEFKNKIFDNSPLPSIIANAETMEIVDCNQAAVTYYRQSSKKDLLGKTPLDFSPLNQSDGTPTREKAVLNISKTLKDGYGTFEWNHEWNGITWDSEVHISSFYIGNKPYLHGMYVDITERRKAEKALQKEKMFVEKLLDNLPVIFYLYDSNGFLRRWNKKHVELLGYSDEELDGMSIERWCRTEEEKATARNNHEKTINSRSSMSLETILYAKNGHGIPFLINGTRLDTEDGPMSMGVGLDMSEIKEAEEERKKFIEHINNAQKLESLGVLAGGIAHDFNNLLAGIYGFIDLARLECTDDKIMKYFDSMISSMDRAKALTLQLLTFSKGGSPVKKLTSITPFIKETVQFALSGSNVICHFKMNDDIWPCNIDKNQIGQVIDNVVINAKQAMSNGGTIDITAENIMFEESGCHQLPGGMYVRVAIKDSGPGIPEEIINRIFDPFFTTKKQGHGLGLATCYSIVNRHGGCIEVSSELNKGSTFVIYLPASDENVGSEAECKENKFQGSGTVIIMDDEEIIREMLQDILESFGFTVICKVEGRETIDCFIQQKKENISISAMILDFTIAGGMGGVDTIKEIRNIDKEVPVFVISGYADNSVMTNPAVYGFTGSLSKPFTIADVAKMFKKSLRKSDSLPNNK